MEIGQNKSQYSYRNYGLCHYIKSCFDIDLDLWIWEQFYVLTVLHKIWITFEENVFISSIFWSSFKSKRREGNINDVKNCPFDTNADMMGWNNCVYNPVIQKAILECHFFFFPHLLIRIAEILKKKNRNIFWKKHLKFSKPSVSFILCVCVCETVKFVDQHYIGLRKLVISWPSFFLLFKEMPSWLSRPTCTYVVIL